jgi:hypothetical protein
MPLETLEAMVAKYDQRELAEKQGAPKQIVEEVPADQQHQPLTINQLPGTKESEEKKEEKKDVQSEAPAEGVAEEKGEEKYPADGDSNVSLLETGAPTQELGNPYRREPFSRVPFAVDEARQQKLKENSEDSTGVIQNPGTSGGSDNPNAAKEASERGRGVFEHELWPYLPAGNPDELKDDADERHEKALDVALFNNIFRDPATGDVNLNPLQMGNAIMDAWRYMGNNHIMDPVFPGGDLNIGALLATTMRSMPPMDTIRDVHAQWTSARNKKKRLTARDFYTDARKLAAAAFLEDAQRDIRWINNNNSVRDFQHTAQSNNTMPIEPEWWTSRRQDDGVFPLQDNLLPAQALTIGTQIGRGHDAHLISRLYDTAARHDPTFNPPGKMGWLSGVPFA